MEPCAEDVAGERRRPGRPAVGDRVAVRLSPDLLLEVDRRARVLGRSRAAVIRALLGAALGEPPAADDGVDRAQIRRALARTPAERIRQMSEVARQQQQLRGRATGAG